MDGLMDSLENIENVQKNCANESGSVNPKRIFLAKNFTFSKISRR